MEDLFERINNLGSNNKNIGPIEKIDKLVGAFYKFKNTEINDALVKSLHKSLNQVFSDYFSTPTFEIFNLENSYNVRELCAITLLRILNKNELAITQNQDFQIKTIRLFDDTLIEIYKTCKIEKRDQSYVKLNNLKDYISSIEEKILLEVDSIKDKITIESFYKSFRGVLQNKKNNAVIKYFIPNEFLSAVKLDEIFNRVKEYLNSDLDVLNKNYNSICFDLSNFSKIAGEFNTYYSIKFFRNPINKIIEIIQSDFKDNPHNKPAKLKISKIDKKYPLYLKDNLIKIRFALENLSEGIAYNVKIKVSREYETVEFTNKRIEFIDVRKGIIDFDFECKVIIPSEKLDVFLELQWDNFDESKSEDQIFFSLKTQDSTIDWESIKYDDPYSPEPVETEEKLIGRTEILNRMFAKLKGDNISSFYIFGQKRVGKTSIAKTLKTKILNAFKSNFIVLYIETGEYQSTTAGVEKTIDNLATKICSQIRDSDQRFKYIETPEINGSFSNITTFLDKVSVVCPECRVLIILDEFDEINSNLYKRGEVGDSFFLTLRAISNKSKFGFILVGGEKMKIVISCQADQINKFVPVRVDYFDKENYFSDFKELVKKPIPYIEFTDNSIEFLHTYTAGNPYFTKIICEKLFTLIIEKRDSFITKSEMQEAINVAIKTSEPNNFAHFWDDGIKEKADKEEEISLKRRKILMAYAEAVNYSKIAKEHLVLDKAIEKQIKEDDAKSILQEFCERDILVLKNEKYSFVIKFFEEWLLSYGITKIITTFSDIERMNERKRKEEASVVKAEEIVELLKNWETYKGKQITTDNVRQWLEQFGEHYNQRLMFTILTNIRFFNLYSIRMKLQEIFSRITRKLAELGYKREIIETKSKTAKQLAQVKRRDILVSYIDSIGKSGAEYAKLFADQNNIAQQQVVEKNRIFKEVEKLNNIKAIIFIDDFVGTGKTIIENISILKDEQPELFKIPDLSFHLGVICGFNETKEKIESFLEKINPNFHVYFSEIFDETFKCFSESSKIFPNAHERMIAKGICYEKGAELVNYNELGFGDCQSAVVFPDTCPNNSLPILWKKTESWIPLFERV